MTAQIPDQFLLDGSEYAIVGMSGKEWFHPRAYGLRPASTCTGCWRGYVATCTLRGERLVLDQLQINLSQPGRPAARTDELPAINGIRPWKPRGWAYVKELLPDLKGKFIIDGSEVQARLERRPDIDLDDPHTCNDLFSIFEYIYDDLGLELDFCGGILLGQDFIEELYVHMGFHPMWKYEKVIELLFEKGQLVKRCDVSGKVKVIRGLMLEMPLEPGPGTRPEAFVAWIQSTFSLDYHL